MNDLKHLYFLSKVDGLGAVRIKRLLDRFGSAENVFNANINELVEAKAVNHVKNGIVM